MLQYLETFAHEYIWYHAFTLTVLAVIISMITVHHYGSERNMKIVKEYKTILNPFLIKTFTEYDG